MIDRLLLMLPTATQVHRQVLVDLEVVLDVVSLIPHPQVQLRITNGSSGCRGDTDQQIGDGVARLRPIERDA